MSKKPPLVYPSAFVKLTDMTIKNAKGPKLLRHKGDIALLVRISPDNGPKTFLVMPRIPIAGKIGKDGKEMKTRAKIVLGRYPEMSLEEAFEKARAAYREAKAGRDIRVPAQPVAGDLFDDVVEIFLSKKASQKPRTLKETKRHFDVYILPYWRGRTIYSLKRRDVAELIDRIEDKKVGDGLGGKIMADRVLTNIRRLFNWYATRDDDFVSPIVRGMNRTSTKETARKRVLTDAEIRALMTVAPSLGVFGAFAQTLLLTAQRRTEVAFMGRSEIGDVVANGQAFKNVWTIPEERYKTKLVHAVPLSNAAKAIIEAQTVIKTENGDSDLVFTLNGDNPVSNISRCKKALDDAMRAELKLNTKDIERWTLHDLRRTGKTLMQRAGVRPDISERVLGHVIQGVEGTYDHYDYLREKREALEALAGLVERIVLDQLGDVVRLRAL